MILFRWWNVESRSRNVKGNAESDEQGRNVLKGHTQATGIIQLLNKEEDMMKEAKPFVIDRICQSYELPEHGACLLGTQEI